MIGMILAIGDNGELGIDGKLVYHIKEDLKFFKKKTLGKVCVMGRKTYESLPSKKLPNREIVIISKDKNYKGKFGEMVVTDLEDIVELAKDREIIICGGKSLYEYFLKLSDYYYITVIKDFNKKRKYELLNKETIKLNPSKYLVFSTGISYTLLKSNYLEDKELSFKIYRIDKLK